MGIYQTACNLIGSSNATTWFSNDAFFNTEYSGPDGSIVDVCKDPKTDPNKKSAKGLLRLEIVDGEIVQFDQQTKEEEKLGLLETVFLNGELVKTTSLAEIRELVTSQL